MQQRTVYLILMWVGAVAVVATLWWAHRSAPTDAPALEEDLQVVVRRPNDPIAAGPRAQLAPPGYEWSAGYYRGDRAHSGRAGASGPESPDLAWAFETQGPITAQAVVADGRLIVIGSHDHHVYAVTAQGQERWRRDLGGPVYSTPVVVGSRIYVGSDDDRFFCLERGGEVCWSLETRGDADTAAAVSDDGETLYFGAGDSLYAVSLAGEVRWRFQADQKVYTSPAVAVDGALYFGSQDDHLYAVDREGRLLWSYRTRGDVDSSPVIGPEGRVYFGSDDGHAYALSPDGQLVWASEVGGYVRAPLGLTRDGALLVSVFGPRAGLVALERESGERRWFFAVGDAHSSDSATGVASAPLIDRQGRIYFGGHDGFVYALTPEGRLRWVHETAGDVDAAPVLAPFDTYQLLLVGSYDGRMYAFRALGR